MCKILIIDDEPSIREVLKIFFEEQGFEVHIAGNGKEALSIFKTENPHIVFLDMMLPEITGREVLHNIRAIAPQTVVIVVTGYTEEETHYMVSPLIVQGVLKKPFRLDHVEKHIIPIIKNSFKNSIRNSC